MNVQEVEARIEAQITGLEDEETRLQEWLECLRKLDGIAAQWQSEPSEEPAIEDPPTQMEEVAMVSKLEEIAQSQQPLDERPAAEEEEPQLTADPLDALRRKLTDKSERKSRSVFSSVLLLGAKA